MKNTMKLTALFLLTLIVFISCKKYPDGPSISLRSRTTRVANTWKPESVKENGSDITSTINALNYTETYDKSGNYSYTSNLGSGSGKWAFQNKDAEIKRNGVSGQSSVVMTILKLKENEFWFTYTDNGDNYEYHMIPK